MEKELEEAVEAEAMGVGESERVARRLGGGVGGLASNEDDGAADGAGGKMGGGGGGAGAEGSSADMVPGEGGVQALPVISSGSQTG